ncbi:PAN domain-containing protein [Sandarakinorhabdus sp.]|uniref:PAN domain-containing protein n=1 Tax=Sandarakinorhabdus sp. TaxID=1916663 RepID=UPI00286E09FF|nr:PAN domain-containing protein [Sandarakinorhabdus sp.]
MAENMTFKGAILAVATAAIIAIVGSTQEPFWWCKFATCAGPEATIGGGTESPGYDGPSKDVPSEEPLPVSRPFMGPVEQGKNRHGSDFRPSQRVANPEACSALCEQEKACMAMTFVVDMNAPASGGTCWLKNEVPEAQDNPYMASAVKQFHP